MKLLKKIRSCLWRAQSWAQGWRCRDKIIVIESDDWGAARMSSRACYDYLHRTGYPLDKSPLTADALENGDDLSRLYEVLDRYKDRRGRPACITANMVMANPDYQMIENSGYQDYIYEPARQTLQRYYRGCDVRSLWREGLSRKLFVPQLHAREHVNWWRWLEALRSGSRELGLLFEMNMSSLPAGVSKEGISFDGPIYVTETERSKYGISIENIIAEGQQLFYEEFGFHSRSTIAPNYCWDDRVEVLWNASGIKYLQGARVQINGALPDVRRHYTGQHNRWGGIYLVRNCNFEQNYQTTSRLSQCMRQIALAFANCRPAILCSHRANYIGSICPPNRRRGLVMLQQLLSRIKKRWSDVVFLSTPELGYMIEHNYQSVDDMDIPLQTILNQGIPKADDEYQTITDAQMCLK